MSPPPPPRLPGLCGPSQKPQFIDSSRLLTVMSVICFYFTGSESEDGESADSKSRFKIHILERGTKYTEKIEIDEDNELEYFHVPAHNDVAESDYLYDFKNVSF